MSDQASSKKVPWYKNSAMLFLVVCALFLGTCRYGFLNYDDDMHVWRNPYIYPLSTEKLAHIWTYPLNQSPLPGLPRDHNGIAWPHHLIYTPISFTVMSVLATLGRTGVAPYTIDSVVAWPFHLLNVLLHAANAVLLLGLLCRWVKLEAAYFGALLFALHPLQVEPVSWVTGLNNELSGCFGLLALHLYLFRKVHTPTLVHSIVGTLCFVIALLCKPSVVVLAPMVFLLEGFAGHYAWRGAAVRALPWLGLAGVCALINSQLRTSTDLSYAVPWHLRPFVVGDALTFYTAKVLVPWPLVVDYARRPQWVLANWWGYVTGLPTLLLLAYLSWRAWNTRERFWIGLWVAYTCFLVALLPSSGIVPYYFQSVSTVADRYVYLGFIGLALGVSIIFDTPPLTQTQRRTRQVISLFLLVSPVFLVWQTTQWRSDQALWEHTLAHSPRSWIARLALANLDPQNPGRAVTLLREANDLRPGDWYLELALADALRRTGDKSGALKMYEQGIKRFGGEANSRLHYGQLLEERGELSAAAGQYYMGIKIAPANPEMLGSLGVVLVKMGQLDRAKTYLENARRAGFSTYRYEMAMGIASGQQGDLPAAKEHFSAAINANAEESEAWLNLGQANLMLKDLDAAREQLERALELAPDSARALTALAQVARQQGRTEAAAEYLKRARTLEIKKNAP